MPLGDGLTAPSEQHSANERGENVLEGHWRPHEILEKGRSLYLGSALRNSSRQYRHLCARVIPRCPQAIDNFRATVTCDASGASAPLHIARAADGTSPVPDHDNFTAGATASHPDSGELLMAVQKAAEASIRGISETAAIDGPNYYRQTPPGFRHFLGTPKPSQRFKAYGIDPLEGPEQSHRVRGLMNRLSRRMDAELHWPDHADPTVERWENPRIPSGYTYLLQFVAHH